MSDFNLQHKALLGIGPEVMDGRWLSVKEIATYLGVSQTPSTGGLRVEDCRLTKSVGPGNPKPLISMNG
jgi:hypothetical protein